MFWSGNYIVVRELNFLLKEENVTLSQVLEADDILQECKANNNALMLFLTRPDILAELITLITEEPPKNVDIAQQYRHANIACEVLTSHLCMLSDKLSRDTAQMNRLCDFICKDPPLNPLLASFFSKTVEMLLERSPKQDWYLYRIVCLRVLDFFKARRDFLPNLLRHITTSAIADTFKYFIRLDDLFQEIIMKWLEEHQFIDCLIAIICGTYAPEEPPAPPAAPDSPEKGQREPSEKETHEDADAKEDGPEPVQNNHSPSAQADTPLSPEERREAAARLAAGGSASAAALLCDLVATGCMREGAFSRSQTSWALFSALAEASRVKALLQGMFTSPARARAAAVVNGCKLLLTLLCNHSTIADESTRCSVELAVAPHLPLLHQALLHDPRVHAQDEGPPPKEAESTAVGAARIQVASLLAHLALSEVEEVPTTLLTLGTPGFLIDMFFSFPHNNFLHAHVHALCRNALANTVYRTQYARHLLVECDLLTRLMDAFEENESKQSSSPRSGYMGHVILTLGCIDATLKADSSLEEQLSLDPQVMERWRLFKEEKLSPVQLIHDTPLGGSYPSENTFEVDNMTDNLEANYDFNFATTTATMDDTSGEHELGGAEGHADSAEFIADGLGIDDDDDKNMTAKSNFLELASQRFGDDMWEDAPGAEDEAEFGTVPPPAVHEVLGELSPWESGSPECSSTAGEGWAQFDAFAAPPADPFAPAPPAAAGAFAEEFHAQGFAHYWPYEGDGGGSSTASTDIEASMRNLRLENDKALDDASTVELANNLLTAMSAMTPDAIAHIVNANLEPLPIEVAAEVNTLPAEITNLPGEVTNLPAVVTDVRSEVTDSPVQVTYIPVQVMPPPGEVNRLPTEVNSLPNEVSNLAIENSNVPDINALITDAITLHTEVSNIPQNIIATPHVDTTLPVEVKNTPELANSTVTTVLNERHSQPTDKHFNDIDSLENKFSNMSDNAIKDSQLTETNKVLGVKTPEVSFPAEVKTPEVSSPAEVGTPEVRSPAEVETPLEVKDTSER